MVSPHFPPDSTAATHRVRLLAPYLDAHGWRPTVLTLDPGGYEGRLDSELARSIPGELHVVRVGAWPVALTRPLGIGDLGLRAYWPLRRAAADLLARDRYDAVYITTYPIYPAMLGPELKKRFRVRFVLDYQDPWVGEWGRSVGGGADGAPDLKSRLSRRLACALEPRALRAADAVTAVSRRTCEDALARTPGARPAVVEELPIGWDRRDWSFVPPAPPFGFERDAVHLAYVGTLLPTGLDTLRTLLTALARARAVDPRAAALRLHFFGTSNQRLPDARPRVLPIARETGVREVVTEHPGRLDYFEALGVLAQSDALVLLGSREPHYTPSKIFPALLAHRPVLALYHDASTATALLRRYGGPPSVRLVAYDDRCPIDARIDDVTGHLRELAARAEYRSDRVNPGELEASSAPELARRLALVLDRVAA
jgi:hypothetical protein